MKKELQSDQPKFNEPLGEEALVDWAFECLKDSQGFFESGEESPWKEAGYFANVNASKSYTSSETAELKRTGRPNIDPPFAAGVIDAIVGAEIAQEMEPTFKGVDNGFEDGVIADNLTRLVRQGMGLCGGRGKMLEAFHDKCVAGYGFVEIYLDLHRMPWRVDMRKHNFWNVYPDPEAVEPNLQDARWWVIKNEKDLEEAEGTWSKPEQRSKLRNANEGGKASNILPSTASTGEGGRKRRRNSVQILQFQYRRPKPMVHYADPETGEPVNELRDEYEERRLQLDKEADQALVEWRQSTAAWEALTQEGDPAMAMQAGPPPEEPQPLRMDEEWEAENLIAYNGWEYRRAIICGTSSENGGLLEDKEIELDLPGAEPGFTIKCDTGYGWQLADKERVRRFGVMRKIIHVQEWFTKAITDWLELMSRKIKGGGFAEPSAFEGIKGGFDGFVKNSSKGGMWHLVADGSIVGNKIRENPPVQGEPGLQDLINFLKEMFAWLTGVSQALQGTMTSDRSNVLTENMQQQGLQMLLPIREPRKSFLMSCGRVYAAVAVKHLPADEIDRILGAQEIEGMTHEKAADPMTGQPQVGPNGKPVLQPIIAQQGKYAGQPMTMGKILKEANLQDYDLAADLSSVNESEKMKFVQVWNQHGLGAILQNALPGAKGSRIWVPRLLQNLPLPSTDAKAMSAESETLLDEMAMAETQQGIMAAFQQMLESDPEGAQQLHDQIMQALQQAGMPEGAQPAQQ